MKTIIKKLCRNLTVVILFGVLIYTSCFAQEINLKNKVSAIKTFNENSLETIWGGRFDNYSSIVFQFSDKIDFDTPSVKNNELRFTLKNTITNLNAFRKYKTFDSWVKLEKDNNNIHVTIGLPENLIKYDSLLLENPYRLQINLHEIKVPAVLPLDKKSVPVKELPPPAAYDRTILKEASLPETKEKTLQAIEPPSPAQKAEPYEIDNKKLDLIQARILSRKGLYDKSLRIYHSLRQRYPDDEDIWLDYIETLVSQLNYELSLSETNKLLQKNPYSMRALKIKARIYHELNQAPWTFPVYENILRIYRNDADIWSNYAFAKQYTEQWAEALNYFCKALELDPENRDLQGNTHDILKEHRPNLKIGYHSYQLSADGSQTNTSYMHYSRHLTTKTYIYLNYDQIDIDRPERSGVSSIDKSIDDVTLRVQHSFNPTWKVRLGSGIYSGLGDDNSLFLGLDYRTWQNAYLRADYIYRRPWYDSVEAADHDGSFNHGTLSFDWSFYKLCGLYLGLEKWKYFTDNDNDYGSETTFLGILTKKFTENPDFSLSYSFYRSKFSYENSNFTPIIMLDSEKVHSLSFNFEHWPCTYWAYTLSGGVWSDVVRSVDAWYANPGILFRLGNRIECQASYEYSSESGTVEEGEVENIHFNTKIIF